MISFQRDAVVAAGDHIAQFYERGPDLYEIVGEYLTDGLRAGDSLVVIATEENCRVLLAAVERAGIDLDSIRQSGQFLFLEASDALSSMTAEGRIIHDVFRSVIGGVLNTAIATGRAVRAYGEMVSLLWNAGEVVAAVELESLWCELARELPFALLCTYSVDSTSVKVYAEELQEICLLHSSVIAAPVTVRRAVGLSARFEVAAFFEAELDAPRAARHFVVEALRRFGYDEDLIDEVALVSTELSTNAVVHAQTPFTITLSIDGAVVRLAVQDTGPVTDILQQDMREARHGHGLGLISALAKSCGIEVAGVSKTVWAELSS